MSMIGMNADAVNVIVKSLVKLVVIVGKSYRFIVIIQMKNVGSVE
jgi:hypothetical protein